MEYYGFSDPKLHSQGFIMALTFRQGKSLSNKINTHTVKLTLCSKQQLLLLSLYDFIKFKRGLTFVYVTDWALCSMYVCTYIHTYTLSLLLLESCRNRFDDIMMAAESMRHSLRFTSHYDYRDHRSPAYTLHNFAFFSICLLMHKIFNINS